MESVRRAAVVVAVLGALLGAACSGGTSQPGAASATNPPTPTGPTASPRGEPAGAESSTYTVPPSPSPKVRELPARLLGAYTDEALRCGAARPRLGQVYRRMSVAFDDPGLLKRREERFLDTRMTFTGPGAWRPEVAWAPRSLLIRRGRVIAMSESENSKVWQRREGVEVLAGESWNTLMRLPMTPCKGAGKIRAGEHQLYAIWAWQNTGRKFAVIVGAGPWNVQVV